MKKFLSIILKIVLVLLFFIFGWGGFIFNPQYIYYLLYLLTTIILYNLLIKKTTIEKKRILLSLLKTTILIVGLPYFASNFALRLAFEFEYWYLLGFIISFLILTVIKQQDATLGKTVLYGFFLFLWSIISTTLIGYLYFIDGIMRIH